MPDPRRNTRALISLATYLERPRTLKEICKRYKLKWRTAYRWLRYIEEDGKTVVVTHRRSDGQHAFRVLFT